MEKLIYFDRRPAELSEPVDLAGWQSAEVVLRGDGAVLVLRNGEDHEDAMAEGECLGR